MTAAGRGCQAVQMCVITSDVPCSLDFQVYVVIISVRVVLRALLQVYI
jgi:hypothetical protein